jgi:WbqC-like protein family
MVAALMQPYFFPYIGYFQLLSACDRFIVLDHVQYIRRGWMNRNRILVNGRPHWITMPVAHDDHRLPINRRRYLIGDHRAQQLRRRIAGSYRRAPFFEDAMAVVEEALGCGNDNVAAYNTHLLGCVARRLGIHTPVRMASSFAPSNVAGQDLVLDLCQQAGATAYINPIGGLDLYDPAAFERRGVTLQFLQPELQPYAQFGGAPVSSLSIIDVMMFNTTTAIQGMLRRYTLIAGRPCSTSKAPSRKVLS